MHSLSKFKYAKISSHINGNVKRGVIFSTYSALIGESNQSGGKYKSRLKQLLQWCGEDFDGTIVFDECHRAKNLCPTGSSKPTKTGKTCFQSLCSNFIKIYLRFNSEKKKSFPTSTRFDCSGTSEQTPKSPCRLCQCNRSL